MSIIYLHLYFVDFEGFAETVFRRLTEAVFGCLIADMKAVLFVINRPPLEPKPVYDKWWSYATTVGNAVLTNEGVKKSVKELTLGCWQIDVDGGLPFLSHGILQCEDAKLAYSVLFFEESPAWVGRPPDNLKSDS